MAYFAARELGGKLPEEIPENLLVTDGKRTFEILPMEAETPGEAREQIDCLGEDGQRFTSIIQVGIIEGTRRVIEAMSSAEITPEIPQPASMQRLMVETTNHIKDIEELLHKRPQFVYIEMTAEIMGKIAEITKSREIYNIATEGKLMAFKVTYRNKVTDRSQDIYLSIGTRVHFHLNPPQGAVIGINNIII